jgi:HD-GYP domain-containing protein (c-di-GMP phosphodiesterase class II)
MSRRLLLAGAVAGGLVWRRRARDRRLTERIAAAALETLVNAIDANDRQTGAHVRRVAAYALVLARAAGLDDRARRAVERVALFHDIGKIHAALFDIVHEHTKLSPHERSLIATHPQRGADVLAPLATFYPDLCAGVLSHHERWDGSGYPRRLRGEQIPLTARIVTIADTFDALTHGRRYSREVSIEDARRTLGQARGTQFDPALVDLFLSPRVFDEVLEQLRAAHAPRVVRGDRRRTGPPEKGPDITFRWRSESLAPPPPAPAPASPRGSRRSRARPR